VMGSRSKPSGMFWTVRGTNTILALCCCQFMVRGLLGSAPGLLISTFQSCTRLQPLGAFRS
jgi:hypothetical protein